MTEKAKATNREIVNGLTILAMQIWGILLIIGLGGWTLPGGAPRWGEVLIGLAVLIWADVNVLDRKLS